MKWNVLCFISQKDKCDALIRIIEAGNGQALHHNPKKSSLNSLQNIDKFTVLIYDESTKEFAQKTAANLKKPTYPYQCILDYLLQVEFIN